MHYRNFRLRGRDRTSDSAPVNLCERRERIRQKRDGKEDPCARLKAGTSGLHLGLDKGSAFGTREQMDRVELSLRGLSGPAWPQSAWRRDRREWYF